jgi:hypothetical protein
MCGNKKTLKFTKNIRVLLFYFVENTGFEPVTSCLPGKHSSQMS